MSTPAQPTPQPSKLSLILTILNAGLAGLAQAGKGVIVGEITPFVGIVTAAMALYEAEVGKPIDLNLIPLETPALQEVPTPPSAPAS